MKIRMRTTSAGPNGVRAAHTEHEVPDAEAKALVDGGYADSLEPAKPVTVAKKEAAKSADAK